MISSQSDFIHILNDFIHVYSPEARAENPLGTNFWCQQKALITSAICCKFQTNLFEFWVYTHFLMIFHMHTAPGRGRQPSVDKIWCQQKGLVTWFFNVFYHIWTWRPSWSCDPDPANKLSFPIPLRLHMKFSFDRASNFGEDFWKWWMREDGWTMDHGYTIKLTNKPKGSGKLKTESVNSFIKDWYWVSR